MSWPSPITRGQVITAEWLNAVLAESKANTPLPSGKIRVNRLSHGTTFQLTPSRDAQIIQWGTLTADYTGGETFTLQPSNEWGTALKDSTGATVATITCKVLHSQGNPDLTKVYIGDGTVDVDCKLEQGTIIPYVVVVDPADATKSVNLSLLTDENQVLAQWQFVAGKVQGKFYYHLGCRMSTVSDWVDVADLKFVIESAKLKLQAQMNGGSWVDVATTDTEESKTTSCDEPGA